MADEAPSIETGNDEWETVRDAMRSLNQLVNMLERREREKIVLIRSGKMVAVVVSFETFLDLVHAKSYRDAAERGA